MFLPYRGEFGLDIQAVEKGGKGDVGSENTVGSVVTPHLRKVSNFKMESELYLNSDSIQHHCCPEVMIVDDVQINRYAVQQMLLLIFDLHILEA